MKAWNVITDTEIEFDDKTTAEWAVVYGYCEDNNLMSALFNAAHELKFVEFSETLPIVHGVVSVSCGDWVAQR